MLDSFDLVMKASVASKKTTEESPRITVATTVAVFEPVLRQLAEVLNISFLDTLRIVLREGCLKQFKSLQCPSEEASATQHSAALRAPIDTVEEKETAYDSSEVKTSDSDGKKTASDSGKKRNLLDLNFDCLVNILEYCTLKDRITIDRSCSPLLFVSRKAALFCRSLKTVMSEDKRKELLKALVNRRLCCYQLRVSKRTDLRLLPYVQRRLCQLNIEAQMTTEVTGFSFCNLTKVKFERKTDMRQILRFLERYSLKALKIQRTSARITLAELEQLRTHSEIRSLDLDNVSVAFHSESEPNTHEWDTKHLCCAQMPLHSVEHFLHSELRTLRLEKLFKAPTCNRLVKVELPSLLRLSLKRFVQYEQVFEFFAMPRLRHIRVEDINLKTKFYAPKCPPCEALEFRMSFNEAQKLQRSAGETPFWKLLIPELLNMSVFIDTSNYSDDEVIRRIVVESIPSVRVKMTAAVATRLGLPMEITDTYGLVLVNGTRPPRMRMRWQ